MIESTADVNRIELRSAATWARGPGCVLRFTTEGTGSGEAHLEIDDRVIRFERGGTGSGPMTLAVQVATAENRLTIMTEKSGLGNLVVKSASDGGTSDRQDDGPVTATLVLFLHSDARRNQ